MEKAGHSRAIFFAAPILLIGLILSQAISTLHLYLSNLQWHEQTLDLINAGYITVPNAKLLSHLEKIGTAFSGGLFFTLTIGAFLSILSIFTAWARQRFFFRNRKALFPVIAAWTAGIWMVNTDGFHLMFTAYFLLIPPAVFAMTAGWIKKEPKTFSLRFMALGLAPFMVLLVIGFFQLDSRIFINFRDYVLLSNPVGIKINDFYYRYTLYPAQAFKAFDQKLLKTCNVELLPPSRHAIRIEKILMEADCLPVEGIQTDLRVSRLNQVLILNSGDKAVVKTSIADFLSNPAKNLAAYSRETDSFGFVRKFTFWSLVLGLTTSVAIFLYALVQTVFSLFMDRKAALIAASVFCLVAGSAIAFLLQEGRGFVNENEVFDRIVSDDQVQRTLAIRKVIDLKRNIFDYPMGAANLESPFIPERLWLAVALGKTRNPTARKFLVRMMDDPETIVRCKVYSALADQKDRSFIPLMLDKLRDSDHLYEQLYIYHALKDLGWRQAKSTSK